MRPMRTLRLSAAMSLDGYIAGPNGEADWIVMDPDIDFGAMFARYDTLLMGRRSYEAAKAQGGSGGWPGMKSFVCSRTLRPEDCPGVTVTADPAATLAEIRSWPGNDIWLFGGGDLFRSLLALGLVDEVEVAIVPVLLGAGLPLLPAPADRASLRLTSQRHFEKTGTMLLEYLVEKGAKKSGRSKAR